MSIDQAKFQAAYDRLDENESDFYATLLYVVILNLFPEKEPDDVADVILKAYGSHPDNFEGNKGGLEA